MEDRDHEGEENLDKQTNQFTEYKSIYLMP